MNRLTFSIMIDAQREDVWRSMLADASYRQWTSAFEDGSYAATDGKAGSKAHFLTPAGNGMVSRIVAHRPNQFLSIQHLGTVKDGVEDTTGTEAKGWAGALENYTLREANGSCILTVDMDVQDDYRSYFQATWPKALAKLKEIVEAEQWSDVGSARRSA